MARHFGYLIEQGPEGILQEYDVATCAHCQFQMMIKPSTDGKIIVRVDPPCWGCKKHICQQCKEKGGCDPWEKQMERQESRARMLKEILCH